MSKVSYVCLFSRLLNAARKLSPTKAAIVGMHFARWERKQPLGRWDNCRDCKLDPPCSYRYNAVSSHGCATPNAGKDGSK